MEVYIPNVMLIVESFLNYGFLPTLLAEQEDPERNASTGFMDSILTQQ